MKYILDNELEIDKYRAIPFRKFLLDFVVPILSEGLIEISNILPDDPVDFLVWSLFFKYNYPRLNIYIRKALKWITDVGVLYIQLN